MAPIPTITFRWFLVTASANSGRIDPADVPGERQRDLGDHGAGTGTGGRLAGHHHDRRIAVVAFIPPATADVQAI